MAGTFAGCADGPAAPGGPRATGAPAGAAPPAVAGPRPADTATLATRSFRATQVGTSGSIPTGLVGPPGGKYLLVAEVGGEVGLVELRRQGGRTVPVPRPTPWLDLTDRTRADGENRGLLGIAMVDEGRRVAVSYTALDGAVTVETFPWNGRPTADPGSGSVAVRVPHPLAGLSGGGIATLPDGDLVLAVGDMDDRFSAPPAAQDTASPLGSLIHVGRRALAGGVKEVVSPSMLLAKGLRNPWGLSVDPATSDVWTGDVGDARVEEIDRVPGSAVHGGVTNFGWPWLEGALPGVAGRPDGVDLAAPVVAAPHRYEVCSIVGGVVYRGRQLPGLEGAYLYGDLCSQRVHALLLRDGKVVARRVVGTVADKVVAFGTDSDGEVYVLGVGGGVFRLDPPGWKVRPATGTIGAAPAPSGGSSTSTSVGPPPAKCGIVDVFTELEPVSTLTPDQVRARVERAQRLLEAAAASTEGELQADVNTYRLLIEEWATFGESRDWDFGDPELSGYIGQIMGGEGRFAGAPALIDRLIAAVGDCPGERL